MIASRPASLTFERLSAVRLYLIADARPRLGSLEEFLQRSIAAGVDMVQLRDKTLSDAELFAAAERCAALCRRHGVPFIVNDRADIALACGADGVHVGQDDAPVAALRRLVGPAYIIGLSTHSQHQIMAAQDEDVDYIGVGPIHATPTKPGRPAVGVGLVRYAAAHSRIPFCAIGGIDVSNIKAVIAAGARSISVLRCVTQSNEPEKVVRALLAQFSANAEP